MEFEIIINDGTKYGWAIGRLNESDLKLPHSDLAIRYLIPAFLLALSNLHPKLESQDDD